MTDLEKTAAALRDLKGVTEYEKRLELECQKLSTALRELEGFAARNVERARKAAEASASCTAYDAWRAAAEARHHEAVRFHLVVRDRVRKALS